MNLIEQLGGYECAKQALINAKNSNDIDPVVFIDGQEVLIDCICDVLLQYRRENNIFEVGDKVIEKVGDQFGVLEITKILENSAIACNSVCYSTYGLLEYDLSYYLRHATDAEIKEGYKL